MRAAVPLLAALALGLSGCLQVEELFTLQEDGSGKLELRIGLQKSFLALLEKMEEDKRKPMNDLRDQMRDPAQLLAGAEGLTAVRPGAYTDDGEWIRSSVTGYFKDVNRVRTRGDGGTGWSAKYAPGDLSVTNRLAELRDLFKEGLGRAEGTPEQQKAALEFLRPTMATLRIRLAVTVPGEISEIDGFLTHDGVTASSTIGPEILIALAGGKGEDSRKFDEQASRPASRVRWSGSAPDAARRAALKAELEEAEARGGRPPAPGPGPAPAPAPPPKPRSLGEDAKDLTDDEVERLFIEAQIKVARTELERGRKDRARETLQGVIRDYPKAKAALDAKKLLESIK